MTFQRPKPTIGISRPLFSLTVAGVIVEYSLKDEVLTKRERFERDTKIFCRRKEVAVLR